MNHSILKSRRTQGVAVGIGALAAIAGTVPSTAAVGPYTVWTHVPSACAPDEASMGRYDAHVSAFKHAPGATGQIVTRCNVVDLPEFGIGGTPVLQASYRDSDGPGANEQVLVDLIQARPDGLTTILARLNSNNFGASAGTQTQRVPFNHAFDFERNAYYVEIRVTRGTTAPAPAASTVRLTSVVS